MIVFAPGRLSTMTVCPTDSLTGWPMLRMRPSTTPPAGYGTITWIGLPGYEAAFCASAQAQGKAARRRAIPWRRSICILPLRINVLLRSFGLDPDFLHDPAPLRGVGADRLRDRLGRFGALGEEAERAQALRRFRILEDPVHLAVDPQHDVVRRSARGDDEKPADQLESRKRLADRRHVLVARDALREARGERAQLAALDARRRGRDGEDDELSAAGERVLDAERHGRVGHREDARPGDLVQPRGHHAGEVPQAVGRPG